MKYRYYVVDLFDGIVKATNNFDKVKDYIPCDDFFVIDGLEGKWLCEGADVIREL